MGDKLINEAYGAPNHSPTPRPIQQQPYLPPPFNQNPHNNYQPPAMPEISQVVSYEPQFTFTPTIRILKARNGIIELEITNAHIIDSAIETYADWGYFKFEFCYRFSDIFKQDNEWQSISFSARKISGSGKFYLKTKLYLYDYQIEFKVRAKHQSQENYYLYSTVYTVNILSSLVENTFDIGEDIQFCAENAIYVEHGIVDKILDDSYLQIKCKNNWETIKIHTDCVYPESINLRFIIDLTDSLAVDQNVLLRNKQNDNDATSIFQTMNDVFVSYECEWYRYYNNEIDSHFMSRFVAINVMKFLSLPYYKEPKVGCLVNDSDGLLKVRPYINWSLERCKQGIKSNAEDVNISNSYLQGLWWYCDICSIHIHRFDWAAVCCAHDIDSHAMCLSCINNKIEQSVQLIVLLKDLLQAHMNGDCITILVECIVGRVIAFEKL